VPAAEAAKLASEPTVAVGHARQLVARQIENESMHQRPQLSATNWSSDGAEATTAVSALPAAMATSRLGPADPSNEVSTKPAAAARSRYRLRLPERVVSAG
jgi:hypothetical protein